VLFASTLSQSAKFQLKDEWPRSTVPSYVAVLGDAFLALWRTVRGGNIFEGRQNILWRFPKK
jgi:hypothetical protein